MIDYQKYRLGNGLTLIVMEDFGTPLVTVNTLYNVGARDENPERTGFAHLFEHLMFGGTQLVPDYDQVVNRVGGDSNAFTTNDMTDYHLTLPAQYLETALWLESDRMRQLDFSERALQVQQSVVTEEYHYRFLNQPYGDVMLLLRPLCYKVHPYRWSTIGADIRHVQEASIDDVRQFFYRFYRPCNATMAIAGPVKSNEVRALVEKWFGDIEPGNPYQRQLPTEPLQQEARFEEVYRDVPSNNIYLAYPMMGRLDAGYRTADLISDILGTGRSSRLFSELVRKRELFTEIDAYITGESDPGLFIVAGTLADGVDYSKAREALEQELQKIAREPMDDNELRKVVNKAESTFVMSQYKAQDCALALCYYNWLGHIEWINEEPSFYRAIDTREVQRVAAELFQPQRQSTLYYRKNSK